MDEKTADAISSIKARIIAMTQEQHTLRATDPRFAPASQYWSDFTSFFDYMLWPEQSFSKLRLHTYHFSGDNYQTYYLGVGEHAFKLTWEKLITGIPPEFVLYEPEGGIGFPCRDGKLVSRDILRYQHVVNTLYRQGILSSLIHSPGQRPLVLEIGAGYGALAHHLSNILGNVTYVVVDLPAALLFSASYLSSHNPEKRVYIYEPDGFNDVIRRDFSKSFDFLLIPHYQLEALRHLRFHFVMNVASFQEMRTEQVTRYLDFIAQTCGGVLYSWNQDSQPKNPELGNLSELLRSKFTLQEVMPSQPTPKERIKLRLRELFRSLAIFVGLLDKPPKHTPGLPYREYLCKPLTNNHRG